ncbi:hypothetical protein LZ31DRAFT_341165 [Colletotrichum somersetense]|nr:hypothetical protein LZ31DRAFT_341165 [Colletotrichum somersetense]
MFVHRGRGQPVVVFLGRGSSGRLELVRVRVTQKVDSHTRHQKKIKIVCFCLCVHRRFDFVFFFSFPLVPLFGGRPADTSQETKGFLPSTVFPTVHTYGKGTRCLSERGAGTGVQYAVSCRVMRPNNVCLLTYLWYIPMVGRRQRPTYVSRVLPW